MKKTVLKGVALVLLLALTATGCAKNNDVNTSEEKKETQVSESMPEQENNAQADEMEKIVFPSFKMVSAITGEEVDNSVFANAKVTVVPAWQTSCGPCILELQMLNKALEQLTDKGVAVLGIAFDRDAEDVKSVAEQLGLTFDTVLANDEVFEAIAQYVPGTPTTFFIDSEGNFLASPTVGIKTSDIDEGAEEFVKTVEALIAE